MLSAGLTLILTACSFLTPYRITFTTRENESIDPSQNTLDLVVNNPALAYVSGYQCGEAEGVTLPPALPEGASAEQVWYLPLDFLADQAPGTLCSVHVNAFDTSTTANATQAISLYMYSMPNEEVEAVEADVAVDDTGSISEETNAEIQIDETLPPGDIQP